MNFLLRYKITILLLLCGSFAYAQPNANFTTSQTEGCSPFSVQFTSSEQGSGYTHDWDFGNGTITNGPTNPSRTYTATGTYTIKHTIKGSNGTKTETKTSYITVHPSPTADFKATPVSGCPPLNVTFTDASTPGVSGNLTYYWVLGTGATPGTSTSQNPSASFDNPGVYNVTLKVTNSKGCVSSVTKNQYITVLEKPKVNFTADQTAFCSAPATVTYTPTVSGATTPYTYAWNFGVGTSGSPTPAPVVYNGPAPAQYNVSLTVTAANGCSETVTKNNYITISKITPAFTAPATVCLNEPFTVVNNSTGASTYVWDYNDGTQISNSAPTYAYKTPGTYTLRLTAFQGNCSAFMDKTITVRPKPTLTVNQLPKDPCPAPQTISFSTTPPMSSYSWIFQNTTGTQTSNGANPSQTYTQNTVYPYELRVTDAFGCKDTVRGNVDVIGAIPVTSLRTESGFKDSGCVNFPNVFETELMTPDGKVYPYPIKKVLWKFGDGTSATTTSKPHKVTHPYTDSGRYKVLIEIETVNGCMIYDTVNVAMGYRPIIKDILADQQIICPKSLVNFIARVDGYSPLIYYWNYELGGSTAVDDSLGVFRYSCADTHSVALEVEHNGCKSKDFVKKDFIKVLLPCAVFTYEPDCANLLTAKLKNFSKGDVTRIWYFGDGNTSTDANPVHTYATKGTYTIKLVVYNPTTGCKDSATRVTTVGRNPPTITADRTTICKGEDVTFTGGLTDPANQTIFYSWYINGTIVSSLQNFKHQFLVPGQYTIKLVTETALGNCLDSTVKKDFITVGGPYSGFKTNVREACEPGTITFTDTSYSAPGSSVSYRFWNFDLSNDTLTEYSATTKHLYPKKGLYDIQLIVTDNLGCKDTLTRLDYIEIKKPKADYSVGPTVCANDFTLFTNNSKDAGSYEWTFGDGNTSTDANPRHLYANRGTYNTQLIAIDGLGCRDTLKKTITATKPYADFTITDSMAVCPPLITKVDAAPSVGAKSYTWYFDDGGSPGTKQSHSVVYNDQKEYKIRLVVTDNIGCKDTIVKAVQVLGYAGAFDYSPKEGCAPLTVNFQSYVKGTVPTMIWDFGDGNTQLGNQQQQSISYTYTKPGKYIPRMIFNNNQGCIVGSDGLDTVIVDGVTPDFETGPACQFSTVEFRNKSTSVESPVNLTTWTFDDGSTSALTDPSRKYGPPGKYLVKLKVTNTRGCIDSMEKEITVNQPIKMYVRGDSVICLTDSLQLYPTGGVSYEWSPATNISCTQCNNPFVFPKAKTRYKVISTDVNGCHDTSSIEIGIKTHVTSIIGDGGEICQGEEFRLTASGARTYVWSPSAELDDASSPSPIATPWNDVRYRVIAYEGSCIPDTNYVNVTVHPKPTVSVNGDKTIVAGTSADLIASGTNVVRFLWTPSESLSCNDCSDPVASPYKTTKYTVKVFTKYNCVDSASATIKVLCDESQLFVPNTFTPNGDGMNDIFMVRGTGITSIKAFRVYNRWGEVMFERNNATVNDKANGWDGTFNGVQLPPDVYIYTVEAYCENGDLLKLKGDVTIIR